MFTSKVVEYKDEIKKTIEFIQKEPTMSKYNISNQDNEFYRFIIKHILFFKVILETYHDSRELKVLISDLFSYIINDIKGEIRNNSLIERSIIENYLRLSLEYIEKNNHITSLKFEELKQMDFMRDNNSYNVIIDAYKKSCDYIHGGENLDIEISEYIKDLFDKKPIYKRKKIKEKERKKRLILSLDYLFLEVRRQEIDNAFHRNKDGLEYLIPSSVLKRNFSKLFNEWLKQNFFY